MMSEQVESIHPDIDARAVLRWEDKKGKRQSLFLQEGETAQIGRGLNNDLTLGSKEVSRTHAIATWKEDGFYLKDLNSTNGTKINGKRITTMQLLKDGDKISLGDVELEFHELHQPAPEVMESYELGDTFIIKHDAAQPRLIFSSGPHEGREILISYGKMVIGRATSKASYEISIQDQAASRPHAEIKQESGTFSITDLNSANGTLVNSEIITETTELEDGDVIEIGETTLLFRSR
jgi:pSer/pThr/pTyr-binding forkhead associated (FHA) protein